MKIKCVNINKGDNSNNKMTNHENEMESTEENNDNNEDSNSNNHNKTKKHQQGHTIPLQNLTQKNSLNAEN